ncbi:MAG: uroporphyrinogen decarboxylase family protein [Candidatus Humimicrobiaceae bacterium]
MSIEGKFSPMERVLETIQFKEPDKVPLFLMLTLHGAKELGLGIKEYFSKPEYVAEGQLRLREKYQNDCLNSLFYAAIEIEAWGGEVIFVEDGPPNSGEPIIGNKKKINELEAPKISESKPLKKVLKAISILSEKAKGAVPVIGVVMSPFSVPIMQMGFDKYLDLFYQDKKLFKKLMEINKGFCIKWANAQVDAGADAICYFDPFSSTSIIEKSDYLKFGFPIAREVIRSINAPTATHFASGRSYRLLDQVAETQTKIVGVSCLEDLTMMKNKCYGKLTVLGNLNGIGMRKWDRKKTEEQVKSIILQAGTGGGFIISDNHGEIPWFVSDETLLALREAVNRWGQYPLDWIKDYG